MTNVYGPYTTSDWETLLMLKKAIAYEKKHSMSTLEGDIESYNQIVHKAA